LVRREIPQGLKPELFFQSFTARLKPCPYYKAAERGSQDEFFRSLFSRALSKLFLSAIRNPSAFALSTKGNSAGAEAPIAFLPRSSARLKPCPYYKTEEYGGREGFFRSP